MAYEQKGGGLILMVLAYECAKGKEKGEINMSTKQTSKTMI